MILICILLFFYLFLCLTIPDFKFPYFPYLRWRPSSLAEISPNFSMQRVSQISLALLIRVKKLTQWYLICIKNYLYIPAGISIRSNTLKLCSLLSPPTVNTNPLSGFAARHCIAPKLLVCSHIRIGESISHILITPSFEQETNRSRHDVLRERPGKI